jgi:copper chaperone CopZ
VQADQQGHPGTKEAAVNSKPASGEPAPDTGQVRLELDVYGMRCQGCATNLRLGLGEVEGVDQVEVNLPGNRVTVAGQDDVLQQAAVRAKVEELGYRLTPRTPLVQPLRIGRFGRT